MANLFGHKWVASFGALPDPDRVWQACLQDVTEEQVRVGLSKLAVSGDEWPPGAPAFRKICLGEDEHYEHKRMEMAIKYNKENRQKALSKTDQATRKAKAKIAIAGMRKILNDKI